MMFDLHVHAAPDVTERRGDDVQVVRWYAEAGFSGCVLKAHYDGTAGRARAAAEAVGGLQVYGGLALNRHVGGINPTAVAAALDLGARVVWMPTADAHTQHAAGLPRLCDARPRLGPATYAIPPVDPSAAADVELVLALIAEADAVLATGHLSAAEAGWLVPAARAAGVTRVLLTHPSYTVPAMSPASAAELAAQGAYAEITAYQLLHQPGMDAAGLAAVARAVGLSRIVLSSDAGQPDSPTPPEALQLLVDVLAREGLDRGALMACCSELPESLVTL